MTAGGANATDARVPAAPVPVRWLLAAAAAGLVLHWAWCSLCAPELMKSASFPVFGVIFALGYVLPSLLCGIVIGVGMCRHGRVADDGLAAGWPALLLCWLSAAAYDVLTLGGGLLPILLVWLVGFVVGGPLLLLGGRIGHRLGSGCDFADRCAARGK
jgi:hypothetical protein